MMQMNNIVVGLLAFACVSCVQIQKEEPGKIPYASLTFADDLGYGNMSN